MKSMLCRVAIHPNWEGLHGIHFPYHFTVEKIHAAKLAHSALDL
ncbi:hypothetical protein JCM19237_5580 [Photobacterium aphoticum]|uniref:Uncharacterized protein n=1 Tax=Photobacterium aphoticum TaxID=754436 RepID=A0A090R4V5_9GAMM|nr:hypothetical protein JCM19237_5580 [Photobacterium aphoticum]